MSSFTGDIYLSQVGKSNNCRVEKDFYFYSKRCKINIYIKKGFLTDLASIPPSVLRLGLGSAIKPKYWRAFILHDSLYRIGFNRYKADMLLDEALRVLGLSWYIRGKIYYGLRMFGSPTKVKELILNAHKFVTCSPF